MSYESLCDCLFNGDEPNFWSDSSAIMSNATPSTGGPRVASDSRGLAAREQGTALVMESAAQRPITSAARTRTQSATTARRCEPVTCTRNTSSLWRAASLTSFWAGLILAAICLLRGYQSHEAHTRSIEQIRPGQRVVVDAPEGAITADRQRSWKTLASDSPLDDIDPVSESIDRSQWRLVRLRSDKALSSGGVDEMWIDTLQPVQWLAAHGVRVGGEAPIPLDLAEMGVPPEQTGRVIDIQPCPPIESGTGRVVLTTVNHLNQDVRELTLRDAKGREEAVRPTGLHKFYSVTRGQWLSASELQLGERLDGLSGVVTVTGVRSIPGTHRVYNMTVQGQHFYRVANCGVLTHNTGCWETASRVFHGTDDVSARSIADGGLDPKKWRRAAGGAGPDPKGFSVTTDPYIARAWAELRAAERGGRPVVLEANMNDLPLKTGAPGEWTDPSELFIDLNDFGDIGAGVFRWLTE